MGHMLFERVKSERHSAVKGWLRLIMLTVLMTVFIPVLVFAADNPKIAAMEKQIAKMEKQLQMFKDKEEIKQVMYSYASAIDSKDWNLYESLYAIDGYIEEPPPIGRHDGRKGIGEFGKNLLSVYAYTQHFISAEQIEIDGDKATARMNVFAYHTPDKNNIWQHFEAGGYYTCSFVKEEGRWKINHVHLTLAWGTGKEIQALMNKK